MNSVSYGESYREKSICMWTLWAMVSLTEWSPYSCELCELWWVLPKEVHIHVNSAGYGESYRDEFHIPWNLGSYGESYRDEVHIPWNFGGYILSLFSCVMAGHFILVSKDGKSSNVPTTEHATMKNHTIKIMTYSKFSEITLRNFNKNVINFLTEHS